MAKKLVVFLISIGIFLSACSSTEPTSSTPEPIAPTPTPAAPINVVASFYPLAYVAESIVKELGSVTSIAAGSVEPHDFELSPSHVQEIVTGDYVVYIPQFMPAFDDALKDVANEKVIDATLGIELIEADHQEDEHSHESESDHSHEAEESHDHGNLDPHIWLNPLNMIVMAENLARVIINDRPELNNDITDNLETFKDQMTNLDLTFKSALADCSNTTLLVSHEAFGYLANQYGFNQVGISGFSPEAEPSPARLAEVAKIAKEISASTIYYETAVDPKIALTLADEIGLETAILDPIETKSQNGDYLYVMEENLQNLIKGQDCR